jgi:hypothetical protein
MQQRKLKLEISDLDGNRYTLTFEGRMSREKLNNLLDLIDLLGGTKGNGSSEISSYQNESKFGKVFSIMKQKFIIPWFSSKDIQVAYEQELCEPISLSTVSTYLSRMADQGVLSKKGPANNRRYKLMTLTGKTQQIP